MRGNLQSWSWKDIQSIYKILGRQLAEYNGIHQRVGVPKAHIELNDESNTFILRFWSDVKRLNEQINCLDQEIARRNNLIGVIG